MGRSPAGRARRAERSCGSAQELARRVGDPHALGLAAMGTGYAIYLRGRWGPAREAAERAEELFREAMHRRRLGARHRADPPVRAAVSPGRDRRARPPPAPAPPGGRRSRRPLRPGHGYLSTVVALAADDPEEARRGLAAVMGPWTRQGYHVQHRNAFWAAAHVALYRGEGRAAWELMREQWPALEGSLLLRVQFVRISMRCLRARCAGGGPGRRRAEPPPPRRREGCPTPGAGADVLGDGPGPPGSRGDRRDPRRSVGRPGAARRRGDRVRRL